MAQDLIWYSSYINSAFGMQDTCLGLSYISRNPLKTRDLFSKLWYSFVVNSQSTYSAIALSDNLTSLTSLYRECSPTVNGWWCSWWNLLVLYLTIFSCSGHGLDWGFYDWFSLLRLVLDGQKCSRERTLVWHQTGWTDKSEQSRKMAERINVNSDFVNL